jgi:gamma-glutamyl-gamma-aminobutyrate hydrolase PuuD
MHTEGFNNIRLMASQVIYDFNNRFSESPEKRTAGSKVELESKVRELSRLIDEQLGELEEDEKPLITSLKNTLSIYINGEQRYIDGLIDKISKTFAVVKSNQIVDYEAGIVLENLFRNPLRREIGTIQHDEHAHAFGDYLEGVTKTTTFLPDVVKFEYNTSRISETEINREMDEALEDWVSEDGIPIPQFLVNKASELRPDGKYRFPEMRKMKILANSIVKEKIGMLLPGGSSIHPKFYGETLSEAEDETPYNESNMRSFFEFSIINACQTFGRPLMGICRGHQALNIFYGGTLDRSTVGDTQENRVRKIETTKTTQSVIGEMPSEVYFNHHQLVTKVGEGLETLVKLEKSHNLAREYEMIEAETQVFLNAMGVDTMEQLSEIDSEGATLLQALVAERKEKAYIVIDLLAEEGASLATESTRGVPMIGLQFHPEAIENPHIEELNREMNLSVIENFVKMSILVERKEALLTELHQYMLGQID